MQHNNWGKDRDDLASLTSRVITESSEDGENPEIFQLIASVGELDAVDMSEFLYGLAQIFDDPDVEDPAFEETRQHIEGAHKAFEGRMGN